uniref:Uncharacterized protein n=1 Tax=Avena sativa TaxID=4498 RepID=A0ACD5WKP0_AVESA
MEEAGWTLRLLNIWKIEGYQSSGQLVEEAEWTSLLLNILEIRVAVLSSFIAHVVLILLAGIRRRRSSGVMMLFLWLAYQLSSWVAPYALTNLSICGDTSRRQQLVAFWATFLLHHLGGPDNISAFSLEDNALSGREALNVVSRLAGASYVLYKHVYLGGSGGALVQASIIIFIIGAVKYGERALALWRGDLGNIRGPTKDDQPGTTSRYSTAACSSCSCSCSCSDSLIIMGMDHHLDDETALILAHDMLPICRRAIADSSPLEVHDYHDLGKSRKIFLLKLDNMCKVVEMELSLIYDILYTKAAVVHTSLGYIVRVASPLAIAAATVLFGFYSKEGQSIADVIITYALLSATFLLDMTWLLRALGSTWMHAFLQSTWLRIKWHRLRSVIVSLDLGRLRLGAPPASESSYRMWSGTVGQYNLLHECTQKIGAWGRLAKKIGLEDVWNEYYYYHSRGCKLSPDVKALLFERVRKILVSTYKKDKDGSYSMQDINTFWGQLTTRRRQENLKEICLAFGGEFQEDILVWHIATQIFLSRGGSDHQSLFSHDKNAALHAKAIKALSEHLMFLATVRRHMLPGLVLRGLYGLTLEFLQEIWDDKDSDDTSFSSSPSASAMAVEDKLAGILFDYKNEDGEWGFQDNKYSLVSDAAGIALELLSADRSKMPE